MKLFCLLYLPFIFTTYSHSQQDILRLKNQKLQIIEKIESLKDSIELIDLKITKIQSQDFIKRIKDSSFTAIAVKGSKLKKESSLFSEIITTFDEDKEVIILDYNEGYFEVCQNSICGYVNEIWMRKNKAINDFIKIKSKPYNSLSSSTSSSKKRNSSSSSYKLKRYKTSRTYYRGPRGGCYYINSNGNKTYVSRSLCN